MKRLFVPHRGLAVLFLFLLLTGNGRAQRMDLSRYYFSDTSARSASPILDVVGDLDMPPKISRAPYGLEIQASRQHPSRSFTFRVLSAGRYAVRFAG